MRTIATIEARMISSRLPGKVLLPASGMPMLQHLIKRLRAVPSLDGIVLATTVNETDNPLEEFASDMGISCFRGSEEDVMSRVIGAASSVHAELIVEITGDSPFVDCDVIDQTIEMYLSGNCDYVSNTLTRTYPITIQFIIEAINSNYISSD